MPSTPRPITNIRPVYANGSAIPAAARSSDGSTSAIRPLASRIPAEISAPRPATWPARSASTASVFTYVLVAATASSGSAQSGITTSAVAASSDPGSFVTAIVSAPSARARATYSTTSGVRPDCERPITVDPRMSSGVS